MPFPLILYGFGVKGKGTSPRRNSCASGANIRYNSHLLVPFAGIQTAAGICIINPPKITSYGGIESHNSNLPFLG